MAALAYRRSHGRGCHIDASMYEICVQQMEAAIRASQLDQQPQRMGNADPTVRRQEVYPAKGEDRWVAITAFDAADEAQLDALTGGRPLADWTRDQDEQALVAMLQQRGIAAGVVQDIEDLVERDESLKARGALAWLPHPQLGAFGHVRTPIDFSADRVEPFRAPALGEHNRQIAVELAGISAERFAELDAAGVLT
jgi:crotonobetainyl-CoA:carnitine CoA-transferase CaiB-like acyl-CoA transferase